MAGERYVPVHMPDPRLLGAWAVWDQEEQQVVGRAMTLADAEARCVARNALLLDLGEVA